MSIEEQELKETPDEPMSEASRLTGIFMEPTRTLADVARRPTWVLPFLLGIVLVLIPVALHPTRVDKEAMIKAQVKQAMRFTPASTDPKRLEEAIRERSTSWWSKYGSYVVIPVGAVLVTLLVAAITMLAFMLAGTPISYKNSLAAWCWAGLPATVLIASFSVLFLYVKARDDLNPLDPTANVISNLSFLVNEEAQPVLSSLLGSIDIFSFWRIILLGVAFAAASTGRISSNKAIAVVVVLWVLYVMAKLGFLGIFS